MGAVAEKQYFNLTYLSIYTEVCGYVFTVLPSSTGTHHYQLSYSFRHYF